MSSGILLEMENTCGNTERRAAFLWCLQRKPQLLGDAEETIHSASPHVAGKIPKCFVTVNIRAIFFDAWLRSDCRARSRQLHEERELPADDEKKAPAGMGVPAGANI